MSSGDRSKDYSSSILHSRYKDLLKGTVPSDISRVLREENLLTDREVQRIKDCDGDAKKQRELVDILTRKGIPMLTKYSPVIKKAKFKQMAANDDKRLQHSTELPATHSECQDLPGMGISHKGKAHITNGTAAVGTSQRSSHTGYEDRQANDDGLESPTANSHSYDVGGSTTLERDESMSLQTVKHYQRKMEAFTVLLFTFLSQLRASIESLSSNESTTEFHDEEESTSESTHCQLEGTDCLSWIKLDVEWQSIREYFPAEFLKGVNPSPDHPVPLRLSVVLDAFQQFSQKYKKLVQDNQLLQDKLKVLPEVVHEKSMLEAKLRERETSNLPLSTSYQSKSNKDSDTPLDVRENLKRLESLERAYANAEERCKQLVIVTQQWSAECADKDKLLAVQATQIEQLEAEIDKLQRKLAKYKKHWEATREHTHKRVSDSQFEELRLELACRKELQNQVIAQRDDAEKRVSQLSAEVDELKDLVEELRDRLSNYKLHAQAKEPTIREMSHINEENRKLKEELEKLKKTCSEQSDKLVAYETYVADLTSAKGGQKRAGQAPPTSSATGGKTVDKLPASNPPSASVMPKPKPRKALNSQQAMVTGGFGVPTHIKREVRNRIPELKLHDQQFHLSNGDDTKPLLSRGATPLEAPPTHLSSHASDDSDNDSVTTLSSTCTTSTEDSLSYDSQSGCGSPAHRQGSAPAVRHHQSITPPTATKFPRPLFNGSPSSRSAPTTPLKITSSTYNMPPAATSPNSQGAKHHTPGGIQLPPRHQNGAASSSANGGDYTQRVRYPNNSGIIVKPLTDDERSLHSGNGFVNREKSGVRVLNEPIAYPPPDSSPYNFTLNEKQCPSCQHVFFTLTEREFQSHVALCFK